ncbi:MAG: lytic transglycosylase domain-containing protein, partial [Pseudomonadota bacterium]
RALAEARMALQARSGSADRLWKAVPEKHAADGGLAKDRMRWLIAKRRRAEASDLIIAQSTSRERLGEPEAWAHWRRVLARQAMRDGSPRRAYQLASTHFLDGGSSYADLEWLSGYIALRYREEPQQALTHFRHFRSEIFTPISLGRAGYWEGRALEEMGEEAAAREAYAEAAKHQTSFYGLLAAEKIGVTMDPELTGNGGPRPWQDTAFAKTSVFQAAQLYALAGQRHQYEVTRFLRHLAETTAEEELVALGDYTLELGNPYVSVRVAKQIAQRSVVAHRSYYPLSDLSGVELVVEEALALSIARRESEFYPQARSQAGALGLMQLMPGTARDMASKLRLPYSQGRLTSDPAYNIALGSAYLDQLIDEFGNNIVLVSVGYNAGPHRARSWMERFGDPRREGVDVVDWIEHIPFRETRNYVMRVAESLPVYRARRSGATAPLALSQELKAR